MEFLSLISYFHVFSSIRLLSVDGKPDAADFDRNIIAVIVLPRSGHGTEPDKGTSFVGETTHICHNGGALVCKGEGLDACVAESGHEVVDILFP